MHPTVPPCLAIWPFMALAAALACAPAHAQDATKALNLLSNFLRQAAPAEAPAQPAPASPAGMLGNLLGASLAPAGGNAAMRQTLAT